MPTPINISASRGAAILGLSKWKTPIHAWLEMMKSRQTGFCEKHGYQIPEFEYNSAMKWGHAFESAIIELAENVSGDKIIIDFQRILSLAILTVNTKKLPSFMKVKPHPHIIFTKVSANPEPIKSRWSIRFNVSTS